MMGRNHLKNIDYYTSNILHILHSIYYLIYYVYYAQLIDGNEKVEWQNDNFYVSYSHFILS